MGRRSKRNEDEPVQAQQEPSSCGDRCEEKQTLDELRAEVRAQGAAIDRLGERLGKIVRLVESRIGILGERKTLGS